MILLKNIKKIYSLGERSIEVLKGIDLEIEKGEFVSIMGVSGSGKSTLLNIIGLMDKPSSGKYILMGEPVAHLDDNRLSELRNAYIGFVFQQFYLVEYLNALENVLLPLLYSHKSFKKPQERAYALLEKVGLSGRYKNKPSQLSGGEQQRVAIARALINDPEIILADEPTGQLDTHTALEVMDIFRQLNAEGKTIIMVTHDPEMAAKAQRVIKIKDGFII
ncbi:MAG: ABC transporter ATP-binding protein [Candidatus Desulfofervidaceae bacterium]|nr:ABC transporter ATP-binding protein [Candidatus Desulfofervidaceae bacterium]